MFDTVVTAALEHVRRAHDVAVDVGERVLDRVTDPRLRREVDHPLELLLREEIRHPRAIREVELDEAEARERAQLLEPRVLEAHVVVVVEVVEAHDLVAAL